MKKKIQKTQNEKKKCFIVLDFLHKHAQHSVFAVHLHSSDQLELCLVFCIPGTLMVLVLAHGCSRHQVFCQMQSRSQSITHHPPSLSLSAQKIGVLSKLCTTCPLLPLQAMDKIREGKKNTSWSFRQLDLHLKSSLMGITQVPRMVRARGGLALGERGDVKEDSQDSKRR